MVANRFLNEQRRSGKSVLTLSAYATDLKQFLSLLSPFARRSLGEGGPSVSSVSPADLKTVCRKWTAGLSSNAAARKLTTLRSFLKWGYEKGYIKKDLSAGVLRPKRQTVTAAKPLTASQIVRLRRTATVQERLLLELLLSTGMRLAEALAIKMKRLKKRIPMTDQLRQSLDYYLAAVTRGPRSYLLVSPRTGRPPGVRTAGMMLAKLGKRAGVQGVNPRNLRATFKVWAR